MPILRLFSSAGTGATVPDATTTTAGKVRLATIAEANGTSELIAVTPAGLQAELAGLTGGMEFKGAYDIGIGVPDLTTGSTKKGDYYVVTNVKLNPSDTNVTKELYGQEWAVGDHLVVTRDIASGETDYNDAITKVDNSESISVLTDLLDVAISAEADGQVLVYDGTGEEWVNRELTVADVLNAVTQADHDALVARVTTNEGDISSIDGRLTTAEGEIDTIQTEQATTQSHAGLNSNGTYTPDPTANYISTATTLKQADSLLDDQVKVNADAISAAQTVSSNIQSELDATQSGAGLASGGAYIVDGSSNYIASATNLADADTLLDAKLKETRDIVDNLGANSVASVNGVSPVSGDVTVGGADIDTAHTASNYTASAADLDSHLSGVDTELGNLQTQITSNDGDISSLDGRVTASEGNITALDGRLTTAEGEIDGLQTELNLTQSGAGLEADGSYVANVSTNYIGAVSTLKAADEALDAKLKETRDLVDNFSTNNVASVNGISPVSGDVTVGAADIDTAYTASNYTASAADLDSHLAGLDTEVGLAVNSVNAVTPIDGALTLGGADIDTAHTASDYTAAASDLDSHLAGIDTRLSEKANSADLADIATSGVASDASVLAAPTEYSAATADVEAHLVGIDTRLADKANSADLADIATSGAASDASVVATPTNYTSATADVEAHLAGIDTKLGTLGATSVVSVNGVSPVSGDVTVDGSDIDTTHTASNYTASAADLDSHLSGVDSELGALQTQITSNDSDISSLDGRVTANEGNITALDGRLTTAEGEIDGLQIELDATQGGAGLETNGSYVANVSTNYIGAVSTLKAADEALDAKLKETRDLVDSLGANSVASVNGVSPVSGDVTVSGADIDSAHTASNYTASAADLDSHLSGVDDALALKANDADVVKEVNGLTPTAGALVLGGANIDTAHTASDYTASAADLDSHIAGIDSRLADKANSADLADIATSGAASDASVTATPTNYTSATSDVEAHLAGIDTKLGTLGAASVVSVNGVSPVSGDVTVDGSDIDTTHTASNYTASAADLDSHLSGVDTELGNLQTQITSNDSDISSLDGRVTANEGNITALDGRLTTAEGEIDAVQADLATETLARTSADSALDSRVSANEGDIAAIEIAATALATRVTTAEGEIDALQTDLASAQADILTNASAIADLEAEDISLDSRVNALEVANVIALSRDGGVWQQSETAVVYSPNDILIRQSYGAWAYDTVTSDLVFTAPSGGPGDRHWEYSGITRDIIFTGVV